MAVTNVFALFMLGAWLDARDIRWIISGRGRMALIMAAGSHFASAVASRSGCTSPDGVWQALHSSRCSDREGMSRQARLGHGLKNVIGERR